MGFVNSNPPSGPPIGRTGPDEPTPDGPPTGQMAALSSAAAAARAATSRYRRRPEGFRAYAWAISLGLHAVVLAGAYVAFRYYFPRISTEATTPAAAKPAAGAGPDSIVLGADATDAVHGGLTGGLMLTADAAFSPAEAPQVPPTIAREPQTISTLKDLAPRSGVESLGDSAIAGTTPPAAFPRKPAAKRQDAF